MEERDVANCPFFLKTGACRFGDRCSRKHVYPTVSPTLMVRGMFTTFGMEEARRDDYDIDACLEHSEEELHESFLEFYHDVLPEFKSVGKVVQFKVRGSNFELNLSSFVLLALSREEQCKAAFIKFNGRWYASRQLHCEICPVTRWKNAICGLFDRQKCPKGKHCNFLHVFRNPGNEFWEADRDLHMSPDRNIRGGRRDGQYSERYRDRSWRQRHCSRSPPRSERCHSRREDDRWRSRSRERSRERRTSHQDREDHWLSRSRHSDRRRERYLSHSRDRSRSRSKDREQDRLSNRSKDKNREHKNRDSTDKDEDTHREGRVRKRSMSRERERNKQSRERSPKRQDKSKKTSDSSTHSRHKHSKKSKKKSKKKHKKKSSLPEGATSSGESEMEKESEEEMNNGSATNHSKDKNEMEPIQKNNDSDGSDTQTFSSKVEGEVLTE
uniref:C3H1-type domain-containing protein n=1 Tax=Mastacembelus armatus TaxID=205130 RepID=A0A3Q3S2A5_9TELE